MAVTVIERNSVALVAEKWIKIQASHLSGFRFERAVSSLVSGSDHNRHERQGMPSTRAVGRVHMLRILLAGGAAYAQNARAFVSGLDLRQSPASAPSRPHFGSSCFGLT